MKSPIDGWSDAKWRSWVISLLRRGTMRFPPRNEALRAAKTEKKINEKTGRMAQHYACAICKSEFPAKGVVVDHIEPCVSTIDGFIDWNTYIERMFCPIENFQVACENCHTNIKTKLEKEITKETKSIRKLYPREENTYRNMISRCNNPKATGYEYYGGRGIKVCSSWQESFYNFYRDMGARPEDTSLDRMDVNGDYTKENCRWATLIEQGRNTTANNYIEYGDKLLCLEEWGELLNIKPNTILTRLRRGWPVEEALGYVKKEKPIYNGRLSIEDIETLILSLDSGVSQTDYSRLIGMDTSQVNRIYHRFKKQLEKRKLKMKLKETKNENIQITMTKEEAKELYELLSDNRHLTEVELELWDVFCMNEPLR